MIGDFYSKHLRESRFLRCSNCKERDKNFANRMDAKVFLTLDLNRKNLILNIIEQLLRFDMLLSPSTNFTASYYMMCIAV